MSVAFFGDEQLKSRVIQQLQDDREYDRIVQRIYWKEGRGCHLGCLTRLAEQPHKQVESLFGIPECVAHWLEAVFEGLSEDQCAWWVIESTKAIPVGAALSLAPHELAYWLLGPDSPSSAGNLSSEVSKEIEIVRNLHRSVLGGRVVRDEEWYAAESAAWTAAWTAAWAAAWAARSAALSAESAVRSAAWTAAGSAKSAAGSAESAAWTAAGSAKSAESAVWTAAGSAKSAESAAWKAIADKSIEILKAAPIAECGDCSQQIVAANAQLDSIAIKV